MRLLRPWWTKLGGERLDPWLRVEDPQKISPLDSTALFLLVVTCIWYFVAYLCNDSVPSNVPDNLPNWWGWHDQGNYYKSTTALAHGRLEPGLYWFGYPLLGVPFYGLMPRHPYFVPNLIMVLIFVGSFFAVCRQFMSRVEAWGLVIISIFAQSILRDGSLVAPWNTLPAYAAIYISAYLLLFNRPTLWQFGLCAVVGGEALFSRPTEIIPIAVIYLFGLLGLDGWRRLWAMAYFGAACVVVALVTVSLNLHFYGHISSPYLAEESPKFSTANYGLKAYQLLCDGTFLTGNAGFPPEIATTSILERYLVFLFLVPGAVYLVRTCGAKMLGLLLAIVASVAFYLTYSTFGNSPYFWSYCSYHYIWWIIPWLFFLTYLSFRHAPFVLQRGFYVVTLILPLLLFLVVGFKARAVATSDSTENQLQLSTQYSDRTYTVNLAAPTELNALDLRLKFATPPSYNGTSVQSAPKVIVSVNGERKTSLVDYYMSQDSDTFDFSFLVRGLHLNSGDHIMLEFDDTQEPALIQTSLMVISFAPGSGASRVVTALEGAMAP